MAALVVAIVYGVYRWTTLAQKWRHGDELARHVSKLPPNWKLLYGYALLGALVHLFQDFTNNYGVRPFAPFNEKWYSWDIVFIIDPVMLVALLLALTLPALMALVTEEIGSAQAAISRARRRHLCPALPGRGDPGARL